MENMTIESEWEVAWARGQETVCVLCKQGLESLFPGNEVCRRNALHHDCDDMSHGYGIDTSAQEDVVKTRVGRIHYRREIDQKWKKARCS